MHVLCIDGGITDPAILAAAALHDTIEDTETTGEELERSSVRRSRASFRR